MAYSDRSNFDAPSTADMVELGSASRRFTWPPLLLTCAQPKTERRSNQTKENAGLRLRVGAGLSVSGKS